MSHLFDMPIMPMNLSFQEKSLWVMLLGLLAAFGFYFPAVARTQSVDVMPYQVLLFALAVALLVVVQVVGHVLIALVDRRSESDERDRMIELKGTRNAAYVLAAGVFIALCAAPATRGNFLIAHLLLGAWLAAQLVQIGSQLVMYRRGS